MFQSFSTNNDATQKMINMDNNQQQNQPTDTVSDICWLPNNQQKFFVTTSWDKNQRIYSVNASYNQKNITLKSTKQSPVNMPFLSTTWKTDGSMVFSGDIQGNISAWDIKSNQIKVFGKHERGVRRLFWVNEINMLMSFSFDQRVKFWDLRQSSGQPAAQYQFNQKIYAADVKYPLMMVGLANKQCSIIDIKNIQAYNGNFQYFETPLNSQTTQVSLMPNKRGYGIASVDGRANLTNFNQQNLSFVSKSIMTFKCHKQENNNNQAILYPVHDISFHPAQMAQGFVFTVGGDGFIYFWDYQKKQKIKTLNCAKQPITRAQFDTEGKYLAIALGYDWQKGVQGMGSTKTKICVYEMQQPDLQYTPDNNNRRQ